MSGGYGRLGLARRTILLPTRERSRKRKVEDGNSMCTNHKKVKKVDTDTYYPGDVVFGLVALLVFLLLFVAVCCSRSCWFSVSLVWLRFRVTLMIRCHRQEQEDVISVPRAPAPWRRLLFRR